MRFCRWIPLAMYMVTGLLFAQDSAGLLRVDRLSIENQTASVQYVFVSANEGAPAAEWKRIQLSPIGSGTLATELPCADARYALIIALHGTRKVRSKFALRCQHRHVVRSSQSGAIGLEAVSGS